MTPWIIGNWKLNPVSATETKALVDGIVSKLDDIDGCHLMVAPSFIHLGLAASTISTASTPSSAKDNTTLKLAAQDTSALIDSNGAFTGDVSAGQLKDVGAGWVIVGHSERRQYYNEDNDTLLKKISNSSEQGLGSIFCIGESEAQFEANQTQSVLAEQLGVIATYVNKLKTNDLNALEQKLSNLIIAYEPVWAIGTGKVPNVQTVETVHQFIRQHLLDLDPLFAHTPIIYGGSVKPDNASEFASCDAINGVLVGGAALDAQSFIDIAQSFCDKK